MLQGNRTALRAVPNIAMMMSAMGAMGRMPPPGSMRVMMDMCGAMTAILCGIGDQVGLFGVLAKGGNAGMTAAKIAQTAGTHPAYTREWLKAMVCTGYVEYDAEGDAYILANDYLPVLASDESPFSMGGGFEQILGLASAAQAIIDDFRNGKGVSQDSYDSHLVAGMERVSAGWFDHLLVQQWIPAMPELADKLQAGCSVVDVGCGSGRALVRLAEAFPKSSFSGFDVFAPAIDRARARAREAKVAARVDFRIHDISKGLDKKADLITFFDSLHDILDPGAALSTARSHLTEGGSCVIVEMNCAEDLRGDIGPTGTILYGTSVLYNTPVSLAMGGAGEGTMSMPEGRIRRLCREAGFTWIERVPQSNPFNVLYWARREA